MLYTVKTPHWSLFDWLYVALIFPGGLNKGQFYNFLLERDGQIRAAFSFKIEKWP